MNIRSDSSPRKVFLDELVDWIGTPFAFGKSEKHVGADCLGLILGAHKAKFTTTDYVVPEYRPPLHQFAHLGVEHSALEQIFDRSKFLNTGNVLVFELCKGRRLHLAVSIAANRIIHSHVRTGVEIITFPESWHRRLLATYELRER